MVNDKHLCLILQVDLGVTHRIDGVITQGRIYGPAYIATFTISYSTDDFVSHSQDYMDPSDPTNVKVLIIIQSL